MGIRNHLWDKQKDEPIMLANPGVPGAYFEISQQQHEHYKVLTDLAQDAKSGPVDVLTVRVRQLEAFTNKTLELKFSP